MEGGRVYGGSHLLGAVVAIACIANATAANPQSTSPIRIGFSVSLTGGLAAGGKQAALAYEMWAEDVNVRGGLLGRKVELTE